MALFGKKKQPIPDAETGIIHTGKTKASEPLIEPKRELTLDQQQVIERFQQYAQVRVYGSEEIASFTPGAISAELLNLLIANYAELKAIRELLEVASKE